MLGNIIKNVSRLQEVCSDLHHLPQVLRDVFRSVVWASLKGGRKKHTIPMRKIPGKDHEMFPHGGEAKVWSQELESVVATCIFWDCTDLLKVLYVVQKGCGDF